MKKLSIFMMAALAMGLTACSDDDYNPAQSNVQDAVMSADGITVAYSSVAGEGANINLNDYNTDENPAKNLIPVLEITKLENLSPNYAVAQCVMEYSLTSDFAPETTESIILTTVGRTLCAQVSEWETAHINLFSKNPRPTQGQWVRFIVNAVNGTSIIRLGAPYYAAHQLGTFTPLPAKVPVQSSYLVIGEDNSVLGNMTPVNPADVYDPASFTFMKEVPEGATLKVKVKGGDNGTVYGAGADGDIVEGGDYIVLTAGPQLLTVNMENYVYEVATAFETIQLFANGAADAFTLKNDSYIHYRGFVGLRGTYFKLADSASSKKYVWGAKLDASDKPVAGELEAGSTANVVVPEKGIYFVDINLSELTYTATHCAALGLIGVNGDWENDIVLTPASNLRTYTVKGVPMTEGGEFKIRPLIEKDGVVAGTWDISDLGGTLDELVVKGDNIVWTGGTGTFDITVDLQKMKITYVQK